MRVTTGWLILGALTVVGLLYTHSQVRLVHQSYALNERLGRRDALHDQYAHLEYDVMALKAPNRLKERLTTYNVELKTPRSTETIAPGIPAPAPAARGWAPQWFHAIEAEARAE